MHLYETHLPVADTEKSKQFYLGVIGLEFGYRDPGRDIVFLFIGDAKRSMLGLWGPGMVYGSKPHTCHLAFAIPLLELLAIGKQLNALGIPTSDFNGNETTEPSVIGWMPSAQLYFRDPDGHSLEFITVLDDPPDPAFIGSFSAWQNRWRGSEHAPRR